ncbi:MAG: hypothetical protein ABJN35_00845 [Erythrobacter sp.]
MNVSGIRIGGVLVGLIMPLTMPLSACGEEQGLKPSARVVPAELRIASEDGSMTFDRLEMCDANVAKVVITTDLQTSQPALLVTMTETGGVWLANATTRYVSKPMQLIVDGDLIMEPIILEPILGGELQVSGFHGFSNERIGSALLSPCEGSTARPQ